MAPKFATAINCIDGRVQVSVSSYIKVSYSVDHVDMVTMPGIVKILADSRDIIVDLIKKSVQVSVVAHKSKLVAVVGHYDCAGNPVCKEIQIQEMALAFKTVESWSFNVKIIGLWVDENWKVCRIF